MGHQLPAHRLVALPLLEGVAGAVPVLVEGEGTVGELLLYKVLDDRFLVFDGGVVAVLLLVYGDTAVSGNVEFFNHSSPPDTILQIILYHRQREKAIRKSIGLEIRNIVCRYGVCTEDFLQNFPKILQFSHLTRFLSYTFPLGTVRVIGLIPYQEPRCLA